MCPGAWNEAKRQYRCLRLVIVHTNVSVREIYDATTKPGRAGESDTPGHRSRAAAQGALFWI